MSSSDGSSDVCSSDLELFGPILQVVKVPDFAAAIAEANNTRFGLSASLIGGSPEDFALFWNSVRAGIIHWNRPTTIGREPSRERVCQSVLIWWDCVSLQTIP